MPLYKKILVYSLILHGLVLIIFIIGAVYLENKKENILNNIVTIQKKPDLIIHSKNPGGYFQESQNIHQHIGTGLALNNNYILTAAHVVGNELSHNIEINTIQGSKISGNVLEVDLINDLALIKITDSVNNFSNIISYIRSQPIFFGEEKKVFALLSKDIREEYIVSGKITKENISQKINNQIEYQQLIETDIILSKGDSGSILIDNLYNIFSVNIGINKNHSYSTLVSNSSIIDKIKKSH